MGFLDERARHWQQSRRQQARLAYLARHDEPSGALSRHALAEALAKAPASQTLVVVKLRHLDAVNASLGHEVFDQVAREITARLTRLCNTLPARLHSDVFASAVQQSGTAGVTVPPIAQAVVTLEQPYQIAGHIIILGASFGMANQSQSDHDTHEVLQDAEIALALAMVMAQAGHERAVQYKPAYGQQIRDRRLLDLVLRQALQRDEFHLPYQPQVDLKTGEIIGLEALIRWRNPELGLISPAEFISLAEEIGLIVEIDNLVLREACRQAAQWNWQGRLSVNVSAVQFAQGDLLAAVHSALQASGLSLRRLDIEITESIYIADDSTNLEILQQLMRHEGLHSHG